MKMFKRNMKECTCSRCSFQFKREELIEVKVLVKKRYCEECALKSVELVRGVI